MRAHEIEWGEDTRGAAADALKGVLAGRTDAAVDHHLAQIAAPLEGVIEMRSLSLDARRAQSELGWRNRLPSAAAVRWTADWHRRVRLGEDPRAVTLSQIEAYCALRAPDPSP
jgi:nucleoside-diphosphate-sugar epimerase